MAQRTKGTTASRATTRSSTDTGDVVGVMLQPGKVHTAKDVRRFLTPIIMALQEDCDEVFVRIDAG